jgi:tRNA A-37 threonylcarbamoyl transferase component Bud32
MPGLARSKNGRVRWWLEGPTTRRLAPLLADPDRTLQGPGSVARSRVGRKRFYRLAEDGDEPALYVKVFRVAAGLARLRSFLRPSKARREAAIARAVAERGLEVARPIAVGEERRAGLLLRSFSVIPERPGSDLRALLLGTPEARERRALVEAFGRLARRLHDAGVDQDDFSPNNFLVGVNGRFALLDFERCRLRRVPPQRRWHVLAKLQRHDLGVSRTDRVRFLRAYLGEQEGRAARAAAWRAIERELRHIRRRDARHATRRARKPGRHVVRDAEGWVVRGRERHAVLRIELPPRQARRAWLRAHQLERLDLPALRPVRLGHGWLELEAPDGAASRDDAHAVARVRRRFAPWGRFVTEPEWVITPHGARLRDPLCFELEI